MLGVFIILLILSLALYIFDPHIDILEEVVVLHYNWMGERKEKILW